MNRAQLELVVSEIARRFDLDYFYIVGSAAVLAWIPEATGFATGLWTLPRVRHVIEQHFGVRFGPTRVWQLLHGLGFSPQRPTGRARQRDDVAIEQWKRKRWPELKKTLPPKDG